MIYTALQDVEIRKKQYYDALNFYLKETTVPIVFVENSNYDMSGDFIEFIDSGRMEYITFEGNLYERTRGKGYGEAQIINEGFRRSSILRQSKYVVKITGRLVVKNINNILSSKLLLLDNVFRCDFSSHDFIWAMVFVIKTTKLEEIFKENGAKIDDSKWILFEHILYKSMYEDKKTKAIPFLKSPIIEGVSGSWNIPYSQMLPKDRSTLNREKICYFYQRAQRPFLYWLCKLFYYCLNFKL